MLVVIKILLATRVVVDEMSSPTTSSPAGLLCMTSVCVFAGRGLIGQIVVSSAACVHLGLAIWFIYMALAYHIMPEVGDWVGLRFARQLSTTFLTRSYSFSLSKCSRVGFLIRLE